MNITPHEKKKSKKRGRQNTAGGTANMQNLQKRSWVVFGFPREHAMWPDKLHRIEKAKIQEKGTEVVRKIRPAAPL